MRKIGIDIDSKLADDAKKIIKQNGFNWTFFVRTSIENALREVAQTHDVEKTLKLRGQ